MNATAATEEGFLKGYSGSSLESLPIDRSLAGQVTHPLEGLPTITVRVSVGDISPIIQLLEAELPCEVFQRII